MFGRRRSKYGAVRVEYDGIRFDSQKEALRYKELKMAEYAGEIQELSLQVPFVLQEAFKYNNKTIRAIKYIADFVYVKGTDIIVEDTKGMRTDVYRLKKKLFLKRYGDKYKFVES